MSLQVSDLLESTATLGTQVRGVARVCTQVCPQVAAAAEGGRTLGTLERLGACFSKTHYLLITGKDGKTTLVTVKLIATWF